jgi:hypothetical protein
MESVGRVPENLRDECLTFISGAHSIESKKIEEDVSG